MPEAVSEMLVRLDSEDAEETAARSFDEKPLTYVLINAVKELAACVEAPEGGTGLGCEGQGYAQQGGLARRQRPIDWPPGAPNMSAGIRGPLRASAAIIMNGGNWAPSISPRSRSAAIARSAAASAWPRWSTISSRSAKRPSAALTRPIYNHLCFPCHRLKTNRFDGGFGAKGGYREIFGLERELDRRDKYFYSQNRTFSELRGDVQSRQNSAANWRVH
jgi:hypothetical protein